MDPRGDRPTPGRGSRLLAWAGHALALAGAAYVAWMLLAGDGAAGLDPAVALSVVPGAALAYALASLLVASGWHAALRACGARATSWSRNWRIHARSQLAKYLPGNVMHFAGRHALGRGEGLGHRQLVAAALVEHLSLAAAALAAGALLLPRALELLAPGQVHPVAGRLLVLPLACGVLVAALAGLWWLTHRFGRGALKWLVAMLAMHAGFFVATGLVALFVLGRIAPHGAGPGEVIGAFAAAWLVGFVVPGAPGGLGVREAALVALLAGAAPASVLSAFALLLRAATLLGDLLLFLASLAGARPGTPGPDSR